MASDQNEKWLQEFAEFSDINPADHPVEPRVLHYLKNKLFPSPWLVFSKIISIHAVVGFFSLGVCHQFGLNPFGTKTSLLDMFMSVGGHHFCMLACGVFFMMTTFLFANLFLSLEELTTLRRHKWLHNSVIGIGSIIAFFFLGAELIASFVILWLIGALVAGLLSVEASFRLRTQVFR